MYEPDKRVEAEDPLNDGPMMEGEGDDDDPHEVPSYGAREETGAGADDDADDAVCVCDMA